MLNIMKSKNLINQILNSVSKSEEWSKNIAFHLTKEYNDFSLILGQNM